MKKSFLIPALVLMTHFAHSQSWTPYGTTSLMFTTGNIGIGSSFPSGPQSTLHVIGQTLGDVTNTPAFVTHSPLGVVIQQGNVGGDFVSATNYHAIFAYNLHFDGTNWIRRNGYGSAWANVMNYYYYDVMYAPAGNGTAYQTVTPTTYMRVLANGNVLIGKTSQANSAYLLDVNGTARANQVVVNSNGADYVFEPGYSLMPLPNLAKFVQTNHHLPDVPSAKEMTENGLNLGENQTTLLRKIEELTLYMVEQQKQIDQLKKETKHLKAQLTKQPK